jgi:hypothetical protein
VKFSKRCFVGRDEWVVDHRKTMFIVQISEELKETFEAFARRCKKGILDLL